MSEKLTDQQKETIKALILDGVVENKEINERMGLKNTQTMAAIYKIKLDLGLAKKKRRKKREEEVEQIQEIQEEPGLTVEDFYQKIIEAKDDHITSLEKIALQLAGSLNHLLGKAPVAVGQVQP